MNYIKYAAVMSRWATSSDAPYAHDHTRDHTNICRWCLALAFYREFCRLPDATRGWVTACRTHLPDLQKLAATHRASQDAQLGRRSEFKRKRAEYLSRVK